ncbi:DEAD/DEAH box helicase [Breoghania sp.]|uniref:DEAD/DEAH box helicase n=1 Tax=Breoghania sp. TaxID=2065378 RepID=UPI002AA7DA4D|nr:DEAD/DEAH box helicase [Breoghania sp.]
MTQFSDLELSAPILNALADENYTAPTPIQAQAIPLVLGGQDLLGIAQTGTGKTAAFGLPLLETLSKRHVRLTPRSTRALILVPTRELAQQVADNLSVYGKNLRLRTTVVVGGVSIGGQIRRLSGGTDILVATPGRLLDLIDQKAVTIGNIETLVLDEADQMLDLGFIHDLRRITKLVPKDRQTLFFSATMPKQIAELAADYLSNPVEVSVTPVATTAEKVDQRVIFLDKAAKTARLRDLLGERDVERAIVFTRTKHGADRVVRDLGRSGLEAAAIHGNKSQSQRQRALGAFRDGGLRILVATDIAARGIDVDGISHVVNYELPNVPETYVHRIGRTARAGATGVAISLCMPEERPYLRDIERLTKRPLDLMPGEDPETDPRGRAGNERNGPRKPGRGGNRNRNRNFERRDGDAPREARGEGGQRRERNQDRNRDRNQDREFEPRREHSAAPHRERDNGPRRERDGEQGRGEGAAKRFGKSDGRGGKGHGHGGHSGNAQNAAGRVRKPHRKGNGPNTHQGHGEGRGETRNEGGPVRFGA